MGERYIVIPIQEEPRFAILVRFCWDETGLFEECEVQNASGFIVFDASTVRGNDATELSKIVDSFEKNVLYRSCEIRKFTLTLKVMFGIARAVLFRANCRLTRFFGLPPVVIVAGDYKIWCVNCSHDLTEKNYGDLTCRLCCKCDGNNGKNVHFFGCETCGELSEDKNPTSNLLICDTCPHLSCRKCASVIGSFEHHFFSPKKCCNLMESSENRLFDNLTEYLRFLDWKRFPYIAMSRVSAACDEVEYHC